MQNRNNAKASSGSKPVARELKPTPAVSLDLFHCRVRAPNLLSYHGCHSRWDSVLYILQNQPFLPCFFLEGLGARRLPTSLLSCMYWQIFINFNAINLSRNKNPRWHLQKNGLIGRKNQEERFTFALREGKGVHISFWFKPLICDSKLSEERPRKPWICQRTSVLLSSWTNTTVRQQIWE